MILQERRLCYRILNLLVQTLKRIQQLQLQHKLDKVVVHVSKQYLLRGGSDSSLADIWEC